MNNYWLNVKTARDGLDGLQMYMEKKGYVCQRKGNNLKFKLKPQDCCATLEFNENGALLNVKNEVTST